jgi:sigma-B regulation protein RsbU (phosphoserine phosphatase)
MSAPISVRLRLVWQRLSNLDRAATVLALLYAVAWLARAAGVALPGAGLIQFLFFLSVGAAAMFHLITWSRDRLLWSLRNRLVVAYLFIAVVPILLLVAIAGLSARLVYQQLAAYLLYNDVQSRIERLQALTNNVAASLASAPQIVSPNASQELESLPVVAATLSTARATLPGLSVDRRLGSIVLKSMGAQARQFAGLVQTEDQIWLLAAVSRETSSGPRVVSLAIPLTADLLDRMVPDLGPIQFSITRPPEDSDAPAKVTSLGNSRFVTLRELAARGRSLPSPSSWLDFQVKGLTKFEVTLLRKDDSVPARSTLFGNTISLASILSRRLFTAPGDVGGVLFTGLLVVGVIFLIFEVAALRTGLGLTRSITRTVDDLYRATQFVRSGDFSHRVLSPSRDQLGELGESFNAMTGSISALIEEQRQRQRLENELSFAREVQSQLFPQKLPAVPGVELAAVCRAARTVSGDYYDFIQLGPNLLGMVIADISGKGISAALLMASLQAALRSQLLLDGNLAANTAELVSRLNRHLFLNTSDDRYATLFYAVYDSSSRMLYYTNAGHLPPFLLAGDRLRKLEEGGMVVGLFDDCVYEQGSIRVDPGSLLVAYSDGLTEPENVYGEQFGSRRLAEEVMRHRNTPPVRLAELLISAAEEWGQSPEQADDMTVVIARLG